MTRNMIGEKIKELRSLRNWTVRDLAQKASITPNMVSYYERGEKKPQKRAIEKLAKAFGITPSELISEKPNEEKYSPEIKYIFKEKMIEAANGIVNTTTQQILIGIIDRFLIAENSDSELSRIDK